MIISMSRGAIVSVRREVQCHTFYISCKICSSMSAFSFDSWSQFKFIVWPKPLIYHMFIGVILLTHIIESTCMKGHRRFFEHILCKI